MLHRIIKHSEVEEQYTKEELNAFYNKVKHDLIKEIFDNPYDEVSLSSYFHIDDKDYPVPPELVKIIEENSIIRVLDYSVIEDLV
jgi:hypothetical protein